MNLLGKLFLGEGLLLGPDLAFALSLFFQVKQAVVASIAFKERMEGSEGLSSLNVILAPNAERQPSLSKTRPKWFLRKSNNSERTTTRTVGWYYHGHPSINRTEETKKANTTINLSYLNWGRGCEIGTLYVENKLDFYPLDRNQ